MLKDIIGHEEIKEKLGELKKRIPSIMLLTGPSGVGKYYTAINFIDEVYRGSFSNRLSNHPDILFLEPDTKVFKLELVEKMKDFISDTAFEIDRKYVILKHVDLMNKESANACLKLFEDHPSKTTFILLAENKNLVLDTIKSRSLSLELNPIKNLKSYIPSLSDLEIKLLGGCLGNKSILKDLDIKFFYSRVLEFLKNFKNMSYSNILDWFSEYPTNLKVLNNLFLIVAQDLSKTNQSLNTALLFLESCKNFKDTLHMSLKLDMHFKNMLIQNKYKLESLFVTDKRDKDVEKKESSFQDNLVIDKINASDNPEIKIKNFDNYVSPYLDKFIKISFSDNELEPLNSFVDKVVKEKLKEKHYQVDDGSLKKRFYTGFLGEMAVSLIFEKNTVDWAIGNSKIFNKADLSGLGKNIGIKTVEWGKFPIIHKNPKRPEIINIRKDNTVYICGVASVENMIKNSTDDLILSEKLRQRNVKTGFYGFDSLKFLPKDKIQKKLNREI